MDRRLFIIRHGLKMPFQHHKYKTKKFKVSLLTFRYQKYDDYHKYLN